MTKDNLLEVGWVGGQALFKEFAYSADGHSVPDIISACANLIANVVRQSCATRTEAENVMRETFERTTSALMEHYDQATNRRRSVVPFNQTVSVSHTKFETKFGHLGKKNGHT
jgi:hypothetical protein